MKQMCTALLILIGAWSIQSTKGLAQSPQGDGSSPDSPAEATLPLDTPQPAPSDGSPFGSNSTLPAPLPEPALKVSPMAPLSPDAPAPPSVNKPKPVLTGRLAQLNLSVEQAQAIMDIRKQWRPDLERRLKDEFNVIKKGLAGAMADASPADEVRRRFEAMQKKYLELQTLKFEKLLKIREVLTPDQRRKFSEIRSKGSVGATGTSSSGE